MLEKKYRLPSSIKLHNPRKIFGTFFHLLAKENMLTYNRFGIVVGKKIDTRAVVRNRLKRVLREIVYGYTKQRQGKDILFIVTKNFFDVPTERVRKIVKVALKDLRIETI